MNGTHYSLNVQVRVLRVSRSLQLVKGRLCQTIIWLDAAIDPLKKELEKGRPMIFSYGAFLYHYKY